MIPLVRPAFADAERPYVTRLRTSRSGATGDDAILIEGDQDGGIFSGRHGLVTIEGFRIADLDGDVVLIDPGRGRVERLLRVGSTTNTLLVTERCDQLCVMCSQPPKKTHVDRFDLLEEACRLAPDGMLIGISGGGADALQGTAPDADRSDAGCASRSSLPRPHQWPALRGLGHRAIGSLHVPPGKLGNTTLCVERGDARPYRGQRWGFRKA
jgi:hypothetical protein